MIASVDGQPGKTREKIVNGNPFLKGFTVKDLKNWAHLKMQGISLEPGRDGGGEFGAARLIRNVNASGLPPPIRSWDRIATSLTVLRTTLDFSAALLNSPLRLFREDFAMADDENPIVENKLTDENPTVKKNKYLFGGVGAVLGGLTGVAIGGPLIAVVGAGLGGLLGYNMLKRL